MDSTIHNGVPLDDISNIENDRPVIGRPKKYFTSEQYSDAQKKYRAKWYQKNKESVKANRDYNKEKERRKLRTKCGFFALYNDKNEMYIGFSKDITSRCKDILKNIARNEKNTSFYDRFDSNANWNWKILSFANMYSPELEESIVESETMKNPDIKFV